MKKITILSIILLLINCSKDNVLILVDYGSLNLNFQIPKETTEGKSSVPTCTEKTPTTMVFSMVDARGINWEESTTVVLENNVYKNGEEIKMPVGTYTVNEIKLTDGIDDLYSVPNVDDLQIERYANLTVPFTLNVEGSKTISGSMFCFSPQDINDLDDVSGGFDVVELQSLWVEVKSICVDLITIEVDNYRVLEIYPFEVGLYEIPIPKEYGTMHVRGYVSGSLKFTHSFNASNLYNPDGIIKYEDVLEFNVDCD